MTAIEWGTISPAETALLEMQFTCSNDIWEWQGAAGFGVLGASQVPSLSHVWIKWYWFATSFFLRLPQILPIQHFLPIFLFRFQAATDFNRRIEKKSYINVLVAFSVI